MSRKGILNSTRVLTDCVVCNKPFEAKLKNLAKYCSTYCKYLTNHKPKNKRYHLKYSFGLTLEDFTNKLISQQYKCLICKQSLDLEGNKPHVDHDHSTGKTRGLLCQNCNLGLGFFKDSPYFLQEAINYIKEYKNEQES